MKTPKPCEFGSLVGHTCPYPATTMWGGAHFCIVHAGDRVRKHCSDNAEVARRGILGDEFEFTRLHLLAWCSRNGKTDIEDKMLALWMESPLLYSRRGWPELAIRVETGVKHCESDPG